MAEHALYDIVLISLPVGIVPTVSTKKLWWGQRRNAVIDSSDTNSKKLWLGPFVWLEVQRIHGGLPTPVECAG